MLHAEGERPREQEQNCGAVRHQRNPLGNDISGIGGPQGGSTSRPAVHGAILGEAFRDARPRPRRLLSDNAGKQKQQQILLFASSPQI